MVDVARREDRFLDEISRYMRDRQDARSILDTITPGQPIKAEDLEKLAMLVK